MAQIPKVLGADIGQFVVFAVGPDVFHRIQLRRVSWKVFPGDFVIHSLRHTMLTRLGKSGADAFTIMRIAGQSSVAVSQRYVHPTPEGMERAFERLQKQCGEARAGSRRSQGGSGGERQGPAKKNPPR